MKTAIPIMLALVLCSCATSPATHDERSALADESRAALKSMMARDPGLKEFLGSAHAYAVFPEVGKGGFIVGGAFGHGAVFQQERLTGYASITQASVGGQIGARSFSQLLVFESPEAFERFTSGDLALGAEATAIAIQTGVSATTHYHNGVAVFALPRGGLMADASISGQSFTFERVADADESDSGDAYSDTRDERD